MKISPVNLRISLQSVDKISQDEQEIVMIGCSVLKKEIELLYKENWPDDRLMFLDSMLHMYPQKLAQLLKPAVDSQLAKGKKVLLIYGDCCPQMSAIEAEPGVMRTRGNNCCDLLLGREEYRRLSREGAFFLMPEWTRRWKEIFTKCLDLNPANASCLMQEMHNKQVYLDTGAEPVPESMLIECANYCGLPYEIKKVSLFHLRAAIEEARLLLQAKGVCK